MTQYAQHSTEMFQGKEPEIPNYFKVSFKGNRRETFLNPEQLTFRAGTYVVVEAEIGFDIGVISPVCGHGKGCSRSPSVEPEFNNRKNGEEIRNIVRAADEEEINQYHNNRRDEPEAFSRGLELIKKNNLNMKLVDVEYQLDRKKVTFFYTAEERVDFRQLVKDLAYAFKTRIEMRQIGVRDFARRLNGLGPCGQQLCCSRFMDGFEPVTTQYAKDQNLPINPTKLSGACGKLKCCLRFEWDFYHEAAQDFPSTGIPVETKSGMGTLISNDVLNQRCTILLEEGGVEVVALDIVKKALEKMGADYKESEN
jgi:cell fate regulator YaaT (PSP1 superfamily)